MTDDKEPCDVCDGSGILTDCGGHLDPPEGYTIIQRCDLCKVFTCDLVAALAWGVDVRVDDCGVIARPQPITTGA